MWKIDRDLAKCGGYKDDEIAPGGLPADWEFWLKREHGPYLHVQFGGDVSRDRAEAVKAAILGGLEKLAATEEAAK